MAEHIGEWHTLTVNDPADTDDVVEVEHPADCPRIPADPDGFDGESYGCSMADEIGNCGFENFEAPNGGPLTPGIYRARFRAWSSYSYHYGSEEWDSCVEVERQRAAEHAPASR
ncbi:hypothetical protein ACFY9R_28945 [Streptomyces albidoflavus]|uniref:hypothetical protein n=1 Tax=Streptomyces albidoflavus TaxID=1886 RepID=UPI003400E45D